MRVLLAEDEADLATVLQRTLREEGYVCDWAADGESALHQALHGPYDAIVLDLMLPHVNGLTILERLRAKGQRAPVLIISARDATPDRVCGLDRGADDYLTKPFAVEELLARLRALIRRSRSAPAPVIAIGDVAIDTASRTVTKAGRRVTLPAKEYALLEYLAFRRGGVVSRSTLYDHLYGDEDDTLSNVLDVYVSSLRRKLGRDVIVTRRGEGYQVP